MSAISSPLGSEEARALKERYMVENFSKLKEENKAVNEDVMELTIELNQVKVEKAKLEDELNESRRNQ